MKAAQVMYFWFFFNYRNWGCIRFSVRLLICFCFHGASTWDFSSSTFIWDFSVFFLHQRNYVESLWLCLDAFWEPPIMEGSGCLCPWTSCGQTLSSILLGREMNHLTWFSPALKVQNKATSKPHAGPQLPLHPLLCDACVPKAMSFLRGVLFLQCGQRCA